MFFEFTSKYQAGEYRLILFYGSCCVDSRFHNLHMYPKIRVMFKWDLYLPATTKGHFDLQQARDRKIDILIVDVDKQACGGMAMGCAPNSQEWWACELLQSWTMTHFWPLFTFLLVRVWAPLWTLFLFFAPLQSRPRLTFNCLSVFKVLVDFSSSEVVAWKLKSWCQPRSMLEHYAASWLVS